jgi:hypothetical protein
VRGVSSPSHFAFAAFILGAAVIALAGGCSNTVGIYQPNPGPTATRAPSGTLLTGAPVSLPFVSQRRRGDILVPSQIDVEAGDYASVTAGPKPQASMRPIPLVPGPFYTRTIVYTAVYFSMTTKTSRSLGLSFALPSGVNADFGTFYLAAYDPSGHWNNVASTHGANAGTIVFPPAGDATSYAAVLPHGVALYQLAPVETPLPQPNPATVQLTALTQRAKIDVMEPDYYGTWRAVSQAPSVATVSPAAGGSHFIVTPVKAGKTRIVFTDSAGGTGSAFVGITTSGGGIH